MEAELFEQANNGFAGRRNFDFHLFHVTGCVPQDFLKEKSGYSFMPKLLLHIELLNSAAVSALGGGTRDLGADAREHLPEPCPESPASF
jgi:hypothetical protein